MGKNCTPGQPCPVDALNPERTAQDDEQKWVKFGVGIAHALGMAVTSYYIGPQAAQAIGQPLGELQQSGIDTAYESRNGKGA